MKFKLLWNYSAFPVNILKELDILDLVDKAKEIIWLKLLKHWTVNVTTLENEAYTSYMHPNSKHQS